VQWLYVKGEEDNDNYQKQEQSTLVALEEALHVYHKNSPPEVVCSIFYYS
jgi:hypothetical protein